MNDISLIPRFDLQYDYLHQTLSYQSSIMDDSRIYNEFDIEDFNDIAYFRGCKRMADESWREAKNLMNNSLVSVDLQDQMLNMFHSHLTEVLGQELYLILTKHNLS